MIILDGDGRPVKAIMTESLDVSEEDLETKWVKKK